MCTLNKLLSEEYILNMLKVLSVKLVVNDLVKVIFFKVKILGTFSLKIRNKTSKQLSLFFKIVLECLTISGRHEVGVKGMTMTKKRQIHFYFCSLGKIRE